MSPRPRPDDVLGAIRQRVPLRLVPAVVRLRTKRARADLPTRALSSQHMRFLLEHTRPEVDLEAVVDRYIEGIVRRSEERWHPRLLTRQPVDGVHHLSRREGGVVLNFMHHGQYDAMFASLYASGVTTHVVVNTRHWDPSQPAALRQQQRLMAEKLMAGAPPVDASAGSRGIIEKLRAGEVVALATDVAGKKELTFAGRRVLGSDGAARIAWSTKRPVVIVTAVNDPVRGQVNRVHPPLDPTSFGSADELLETMVRTHEASILDWPEMADQPARRWTILDDADRFPPPME